MLAATAELVGAGLNSVSPANPVADSASCSNAATGRTGAAVRLTAELHLLTEYTPLTTAQSTKVFTRLHALFPGASVAVDAAQPIPSPAVAGTPQAPLLPSPATVQPTHAAPRFLKVKILTWNMYESLPKGNLEDLLGVVPPYKPRSSSENDELRIPNLALDGRHPYHLVVIAGQECPTSSGIPLGLAANFKSREKEKAKEKEKEKEGKPHKHRLKVKAKGKDVESDHIIQDNELELSGETLDADPSHPHAGPSGWSAVLEDWYCHGLGSSHSTKGNLSTKAMIDPDSDGAHPPLSQADAIERMNEKKLMTQGLGPYELLVKERLMGIYLAVFIYRDIKHLVRGVSKSTVTAGLIGGRVGNKGAVGISINLAGTTLLLMNAHLAAHEGRVTHRFANLAKIKAELDVDDFLAPQDTRRMAEDITDKFDYTFVFGDLNFRLNVTRLHADWLISRQEYTQALAFDQLRSAMQMGEAFVGFQEATINFPPTFKYDVLRTLKASKSHSKHSRRQKFAHMLDLSEVEESRADSHDGDDGREDGEGEVDAESASVASTVFTSLHSRRTTDVEDDSYDYFRQSPSSTGHKRIMDKAFISNAAKKAKSKWISLLSPSAPTTPAIFNANGSPTCADVSTPVVERLSKSAVELSVESPRTASSIDLSTSQSPNLLRPDVIKRAASAKAVQRKAKSDAVADDGKGVYDSSSKKRVPSWCDRILWKSTVQPEPYDEEYGNRDPRTGLRPRVMSFISQAFRPLAFKARQNSQSTLRAVETPSSGVSSKDEHSPRRQSFHESRRRDTTPISDFLRQKRESSARPPKLYQSKSIEPVPVTAKPPMLLSAKTDIGIIQRGRSFSASQPSFNTRWQSSQPTISDPTPLPNGQPGSLSAPVVPPRDFHNRANTSRWWMMPFLSRDSGHFSATPTLEAMTTAPRKGEVVPLSYDTLDDQAMHKLEGRSDHRPVIGSYAIYI